jgi:prepilin-type N-terminal cleavage/methylation domain-containing protein
MRNNHLGHGFTMVELMATLCVVAILALIAMPLFTESLQRSHLQLVAEQITNDLKFAQMDSLRRQMTIAVSIKPGTNWCYGLSDKGDCDCTKHNSCKINDIEYVQKSESFQISELTISSLPQGIMGGVFSFDGFRGTTNAAGKINAIIVGHPDKAVSLSINRLGYIEVCSPHSTVSGYKAC